MYPNKSIQVECFRLPGSWYFRFRARCVSCNGMYRVSALGGLRGADGGVIDVELCIPLAPPLVPIPLVGGGDTIAVEFIGHKNARCSSHPTSDMMLAFRKYGVTSRKNFTATKRKPNEK